MQRLNGKAAIVTGSGGGIGRQIALAFAREGASVLVVDIRAKGVPETVQQIEARGGRALGLHKDIAAPGAVEEIVAACVERFGRLDCIVNNAADQTHKPLEQITEAHWDGVQAVNVKAAMLFAQVGLPHLLAHPGGSIVNISSIRGERAMTGGLAYDTSKAAMLGLTRALAVELGRRGVRVNAICPGQIMSYGEEQWKAHMSARLQQVFYAAYPLGRLGRPEEIASVAVFLASEEASFITGQAIMVDGGMSILNPETAVLRTAEIHEGV
jgi:NAD(P)-dependent dehydrogenase (short-subunit alcohol dehydrogenase family)